MDVMLTGLFEPDLWRNVRWIRARLAIRNGSRKCRAKNRVRIGL